MKKTIIYSQRIMVALALLFITLFANAQNKNKQKSFELTGTVTNEAGNPVQGALVTIQESFIDTETSEDGRFSIEVPKIGSILIVDALGYDVKMIRVDSKDHLAVVLKAESKGQGSRDVVYMPWYQTHKKDLTAAVSTIGYDELRQSPVMTLSNALSGRLPGLSTVQTAGLPGYDEATLRIRGMRTLESRGRNSYDVGGIGKPLVIVDGFERNFDDLDADEIESFTVLKDAAATSLYGMRAANGVIMITTKKGQLNKRSITLNLSSGFLTPTHMPKFLDAVQYATLHNEARINDGLEPLYTEDDIELYRNGQSPLTHPNVDYYDEFYKKSAWTRKGSLTVTGGNRFARYFILAGYTGQDGLFKRTDENPDPAFRTKVNYNKYNIRSNIDINITDWMLFTANIAGRIEERKYPDQTSKIINVLSSYPSNAIPLSFMGIDPDLNKEILMLGGNSIYRNNPLALLSHDGYYQNTTRNYQVTAKLDIDFTKFITPGLGFSFVYYMDGSNTCNVHVGKNFRTWEYSEDAAGNPHYRPFGQEASISRSWYFDVFRYNGLDAKIYYDRTFGKHKVNAFLLYTQQRSEYPQANYPDMKWQNNAIKASYSYDNRYFFDFVGSYMGNDNFYWTNHGKTFFPSVSAAWSIADEPWMDYASDYLDVLKLRLSYGITGNDQYGYTNVNDQIERYPSRVRWWSYSRNYWFGIGLMNDSYGLREGRAPNKDLAVEKAAMWNLGIEAALFQNRLTMSADLWAEHRYNIYTVGVGSIPAILGVSEDKLPITNDGVVDSKGLEVSLGWQDKVGKFSYAINGFVDYNQSKIVQMGEPAREFANLIQTGNMVGQDYGLESLGLFKDWDDVNNSPQQMFGPYQPGDIKYRDVNNDGQINDNDYVKLGKGNHPRLNYAIELYFNYAGLYLDLLFQGMGCRSVYLANNYTRAFYDNGNISEFAINRYHSNPDGTTNFETADYPRLTTLSNDNNWRTSTFWMRDVSFLRLKNAELGYSLPKKVLQGSKVDGVKFYVNTYNAFTITNLKDFDPEDVNAGITRYPQNRIFNFGVTLTF